MGPLALPGPNTRLYRQRRAERLRLAREKGTHTQLEWLVLKGIFGNCCVKCGRAGTEKDHIIPLHQEGSDSIDNLQPLCAFCNTGKGPEDIDYRDDAYPKWREHLAKVLRCIEERLD